MKRSNIIIVLFLAGCTPQTQEESSTSTQTVSAIDLINAGDAASCSHEDVRANVISAIQPKDSDKPFFNDLADYQAGRDLITYNLDTIALAAVDKSIKSISCDANVIVHYKEHEDKTFPVRFVLRPSVEDQTGFIINTTATEAIIYAKTAASDAASSISLARTRAAQEEEVQNEAQQIQADPVLPNKSQNEMSLEEEASANDNQ